MPFYHLCEERAEKLPDSIIFRGRTQPGMCPVLENNSAFYNYVISKRLCRLCKSKLEIDCEYLKQFELLTEPKIIFTVKENLNLLLQKTNPIVIIIDDVNIVDIIYHSKRFKLEAISLAKYYFSPELNEIFDALLTIKFDLVQKLVKEKKEIIEKELEQLENEIFKDYEFYKDIEINTPLHVLSILYNAIDKNLQFLPIRATIRICWEEWDLLGKRVVYQTATPTLKEKEVFDQLGEYDTIHEDAEPNPNWKVLQLKGAIYPLTTCLRSKQFEEVTSDIYELVLKFLKFLEEEEEMVFFTANKLQKSVFSHLKGEEKVKLLKHYEKGTLGSNCSKEALIGVVGGILYKNLDFYLKPPYIDLNDPILYERLLNQKIFDYPVERIISDDEVVNHIKQELGRIFRGDREKKKLCIVISGVKLSENGYIPEIGAVVEKRNKEEIKKR